MEEKIVKSEEEWRKELSPDTYHVTREKGTEPAFSGKYYAYKEKGMYKCSNCKNPLFSSDTKYDSGTGWPSFYAPLSEENIATQEDMSHGMRRTEVVCNRCGAHLGHVFDDGPAMVEGKPATGKRYCINSLALDFQKKNDSKG